MQRRTFLYTGLYSLLILVLFNGCNGNIIFPTRAIHDSKLKASILRHVEMTYLDDLNNNRFFKRNLQKLVNPLMDNSNRNFNLRNHQNWVSRIGFNAPKPLRKNEKDSVRVDRNLNIYTLEYMPMFIGY